MKYHTALLIGRFQPFHKGHLYLLKKALQQADKLVVGIGSANISDENNPMDYETRMKIVKAVIYKEKLEERLIKIVPLDDFFNDKKWLNNVKKQAGSFDLVVGNNEWTNKILEKVGFSIRRFPYFKRSLYEGWRVRKLIAENKPWEDRIPDYLISNLKFLISKQAPNFQQPISKFNHVVLGGTFDHFHLGHEKLVETACRIGKKVTIGISTEKLYKNKLLFQIIETFEIRKQNVLDFLSKKNFLKKTFLISFSDFKGDADKEVDIDSMVVSRLTYPNALKINQLREKNKLKPLRIFVIKDVLAADGKLLSSERIRTGEIDRQGKIYLDVFKKTLFLPENLRERLRKPLGQVFENTKSLLNYIKKKPSPLIVAVGDIIAMELEKKGFIPDVKIIDFRSRRQAIKTAGPVLGFLPKPSTPILNKPGTINSKSSTVINSALKKYLLTKKPQTVIIKGEEDLLALPAILLAPLGSLIFYGHWQLGVVVVEATEKSKEKIISLIKKFD